MFERHDWSLFRSLDTLGQKAGVSRSKLPMLVAKELVDNALDASVRCRFGIRSDGVLWVSDDGPGLPGRPRDIARLFSLARPLRSSKLLRLPTRGALGNGLRVITGAVLATGGRLIVYTSRHRLVLIPRDDGSTEIAKDERVQRKGTRVEVKLGPPLVVDNTALHWARSAARLAQVGDGYSGCSSPYWYTPEALFELLQAAGAVSVEGVVTALGGSDSRGAGFAGPLAERRSDSVGREAAVQLLRRIRRFSEHVPPEALGAVGRRPDLGKGYAISRGTFKVLATGGSDLHAEIPFSIECWAGVSEEASVALHVNRTPVTSDVEAFYPFERTRMWVAGCGLEFDISIGRRPLGFCVNIDTPYVPFTSDGKSPDLSAVEREVATTLENAAKKGRRGAAATGWRPATQKEVLLGGLEAAIVQASGDGTYRYSQRQLYYALRPTVIEQTGQELKYNNFEKVITEYESRLGRDLPGMYRDPRGVLYHPHLRQEIPVGTLSIEEYRRPEWTFNKLLYIEKEGFFSILKEARWPEQHDCALLTSKGYASRAARDVIDLLGADDQRLIFFCVHDADAFGTAIYESLQEATAARAARTVDVINLGLDPWEALKLGLQAEPVEGKEKTRPVAKYVHARNDGEDWVSWLQHNRVELNAMTSPQFIAWLNLKVNFHGKGKLVPPRKVLGRHLRQQARAGVVDKVREQVLKEGGFEQRVDQVVGRLRPALARRYKTIEREVRDALDAEPALSWRHPVDQAGADIASAADSGAVKR